MASHIFVWNMEDSYAQSVEKVLKTFNVTAESGLSQGKAQESLEKYGRNGKY